MSKVFFNNIKIQSKPLLFVLFVSFIGFSLNLYPLPLFANIQLILGNIAFIIVAMRFGVLYSLFSALIVSSALIFSFSHPFGFLIFGLEAVFIASLRARGWYVFYADILYWIIVGMPLTAILLSSMSNMPEQLWFLTIIKQALNGLIYACLAGLIVYFFPKTFAFRYRQQPRILRSFKSQLVYATTLIISVSLMTTSLFVSQSVLDHQHQIIEKNLQEHKHYLTKAANQFIHKHVLAIENAAQGLRLIPEPFGDEATLLLTSINRNYDDFSAMYIADKHGEVNVSSPQGGTTFKEGEPKVNVAFRDYFNRTIRTDEVYISTVLSGESLGNTPIVSISKIFTHSDIAYPAGIVQGSLNLATLSQLIPKPIKNEVSYVITDGANHVVFASAGIPLQVLKPFVYQDKKDITFRNTGLITFTSPDKHDDEPYDFFLTSGELENNWKIHVLLNSNKVIDIVEREYLLIFALLLLAFLISISLAQKIGQQITRPLNFILSQLKKFEVDNGFEFKPMYSNSAQDIVSLYDELKRNKLQINDYQIQLEQQVAERTNELKLANEKLTQLAQKDGLTQIYNRRYFDEHFPLFQKMAFRSDNNLALVLIDLDHFKAVNDTHGHLTGDHCLKEVANILLGEFVRATDLIARYGGEEFIILINQISETTLVYKLNKLRTAIEKAPLYNENNEVFHITASIGAVLAPATFSKEAPEWIKIADLCLYKAKHSGRNNVKLENFSELL